ncbi:sensor histidine kinase N-terminal domain-containing protein [Rhizobacter sp. J219]|uniref:sensor histidine kinase n=1 Tax=Rhizobacter sp. J219 TaxID=2898430 RepID=UPI002151502A|nr:sensor histidine kinase N-terminal domain-containing protein [Rhizobacter sp. J219]MCR5884726.1 sensor histidine kinase N-terminal domain-containing protein [Rhizobacter sp. J219]
MLAPLLLLWPMSVVLTWLVAQGIANKPFDRQLGELTRLLSQQIVLQLQADGTPRANFSLTRGTADLLQTDETDTLYYQVLGLRGEFLSGDRHLPVPPDEDRGPQGQLRFRDDTIGGEPVRVAYQWVTLPGAPGGPPALVQAAETLGKRSRLATEIIKGVMLPQFVILPLAVLLVWLALVRGIAPLNELQQRIRHRESHDLSPIDEREVPEEVSPLVRAINDLLMRLDRSISTQKHFLADAAHQLKTPLAGLRTQAELAQREIDAGQTDPQSLKKSLQQIARSSQRAARMVNQLLAMARAEDASQAQTHQPVNLARVATEVVRDFVPRALEKRIDLGYEGPATGERHPPGLMVQGQPVLLRELVRNLVDNALQYTPEGGTVTVRVVDDPFGQVVVLQVEDSGPGIAPAERDKVFQPFYRALGTNVDGSGLGLAIVKEIAQQHHAEIALEDANLRLRSGILTDHGDAAFGPGARFTVRFAAAPASDDNPTPPSADAHD